MEGATLISAGGARLFLACVISDIVCSDGDHRSRRCFVLAILDLLPSSSSSSSSSSFASAYWCVLPLVTYDSAGIYIHTLYIQCISFPIFAPVHIEFEMTVFVIVFRRPTRARERAWKRNTTTNSKESYHRDGSETYVRHLQTCAMKDYFQ